MARPKAWRYPPDGGPITPLKKIELLVGTTRMIADGMEECSIQVRGELEIGDKVKIQINEQEYEIDSDDMLIIKTITPGLYQVEMVDDRYWADKYSFTVMAVTSEVTDA